MLELKWTYSNSRRLTQWYGHVDYYGPYIIGQWFALDAATGAEYWSHRIGRPTTICGCTDEVIVATETRSDGPWTLAFGVYGISAKDGKLIWTNHARGLWGKIVRALDYVPGFTNELRDAPRFLADGYVVTERNRTLDIQTGRERHSVTLSPPGNTKSKSQQLYDNRSLEIVGRILQIERNPTTFSVACRDKSGNALWQFSAKDHAMYVNGNYYSYRLHDNRILVILSDAPESVPISPEQPLYHRANSANYSLGIIDISTGGCNIVPLAGAKHRLQCRLEAIHGSRLLVSCDNKELTEYEMTA